MNIKQKAQQGFTLIELMIVIAIVGILAAIALPAYQDYIVRAKLSEPLAAMAEAKTTVAEYVAANGDYPSVATAFGINTAPRDQSEIIDYLEIPTASTNAPVHIIAWVHDTVWDGGDASTSSASAAFKLSGSTNDDGTMTWACLPGDEGGSASNEIELKYLPANCRGG
jgi:type IV pilus assembly protein PilA